MDKDGCAALSRVLNAYAAHNPSVGYCQGMNFLAGLLLLFMPEEDAFWGLVCLVERLLCGYFNEDMVEAQVDQRSFKHLCDQQFPSLSRHMATMQVDISFVCSNWFLTAFINVLPLEAVLRVWDTLLFEMESSVLFRVAAAIVDRNTQDLMAQTDSVDVWTRLQRMPQMCFDSSALVDVALLQYSHINREMLDEIRELYRGAVLEMIAERGPRPGAAGGSAHSREVVLAGQLVNRRLSVDLDQESPINAAFFSFLESKASRVAAELASPPPKLWDDGEQAGAEAEAAVGGHVVASSESSMPDNARPRAEVATPADARARCWSLVAQHIQPGVTSLAQDSRAARPDLVSDGAAVPHGTMTGTISDKSRAKVRLHSSSPPRRAANATQLVVAAYTAAHTILEAERSNAAAQHGSKTSASWKSLHSLERNIISEQQQAAETRRHAHKLAEAATDIDRKAKVAAEREQVAAAKLASDAAAARELRDSIPVLEGTLQSKERELLEAEQQLQEEHDKMAHLDTVLDDLLEAQKNWHRADRVEAAAPALATQPSVTQVIGSLFSSSLKKLRA